MSITKISSDQQLQEIKRTGNGKTKRVRFVCINLDLQVILLTALIKLQIELKLGIREAIM